MWVSRKNSDRPKKVGKSSEESAVSLEEFESSVSNLRIICVEEKKQYLSRMELITTPPQRIGFQICWNVVRYEENFDTSLDSGLEDKRWFKR